MNVIAKKLMGGGNTLIYLLVAVLVIATGSAWAADVDMEGKEAKRIYFRTSNELRGVPASFAQLFRA